MRCWPALLPESELPGAIDRHARTPRFATLRPMTRERPERLPVVVTETYEEVAALVAKRMAEIIRARRQDGRAAVLGLATGSTPVGIYRELIRMHRTEGLDFSGVVTFN